MTIEEISEARLTEDAKRKLREYTNALFKLHLSSVVDTLAERYVQLVAEKPTSESTIAMVAVNEIGAALAKAIEHIDAHTRSIEREVH